MTAQPITFPSSTPPDAIAGQAYSFSVQVNGGIPPYTATETTNLFPGGQGAAGTPCQGLSLNLATRTISGTPVNTGTCGPVTLQVRDSSNPALTASVSFSLRVIGALAISTASMPNGTEGVAYSQTVITSGGLAPIAFSITAGALPNGLNLNGGTGAITGTPTTGGTFNFTVQARDAFNPAQVATRAYTVRILQITTTALPDGLVGQAYNQPLAATGEVSPLMWTLATGSGPLPPGLTLNANGTITGTPTAPGAFNFTAQATDSDNPARTDTQALSIRVIAPLAISTPTLANGTESAAYIQTVMTTGGLAPVSFAVTAGALPAGLLLNPATGAIGGTPTTGGMFNFTVTASDSLNPSQTNSQAYSVLVLQITTASLPGGAVGQPYNQALAVIGEVAPVTWALASGSGPLPAGLALNPNSTISGTPTTPGTFNFTVQATDSDTPARTHVRSLSITVAPAPLSITTQALPNGTDGAQYTQNITTTGGVPPVTFALAAPGGGLIPPGLVLNPGGLLTGVPNTGGRFNFTVQATDSALNTDVKSYSVLILQITNQSLANGAEGQAYNQNLTVAGQLAPVLWGVSGGMLPPGVALNPATGALAGVPIQGGTFAFAVDVTDSDTPPRVTTRSYVVRILQITTTLLPDGTEGVPYSQTLTALGDVAPLTWALAPGSGPLPPGWTVNANGTVSGTATMGGTFTFTVQATDSDTPPRTHTKSYTLLILQITTSALPDAAQGQAYSQTLFVTGEIRPATWSLAPGSGPLPDGLTLNANGDITGTPTTAGTFNFTVQVTDSGPTPRTHTRNLSITVNAPTMQVVNVLEDGSFETSIFLNNLILPHDKQFSVSADGRYVAFTTADGRVLVRDTCKGNAPASCTPSTVSTKNRNASPLCPPFDPSRFPAHSPSISADGRWVAFRSEDGCEETGSPDFMSSPPIQSGSSQFYIHDTQSQWTFRIPDRIDNTPNCSPNPNFRRGVSNPHNLGPAISADGRYVLFSFQSDNCVTLDITSVNIPAVLVYDRDTDRDGVFDEPGQTGSKVVSFRKDGTLFGVGNFDFPTEVALSGDGLVVALVSTPVPPSPRNIFLRDHVLRTTVDLTDQVPIVQTDFSQPDMDFSSVFVSFAEIGASVDHLFRGFRFSPASVDRITPSGIDGRLGSFQPPSLSTTGRFLAFSHSSDALDPSNNSSGTSDVFIWDANLSAVRSLTGKLPGGTPTMFGSVAPRLSADARFVVFISGDQFDPAAPAGVERIFIAPTGASDTPTMAPSVTGVNPENVPVGSATRLITIAGDGFTPGSVVLWNGEERPGIYVSPSQLRVRLRAEDLAVSRSHAVTVRNADGRTANQVASFNVK